MRQQDCLRRCVSSTIHQHHPPYSSYITPQVVVAMNYSGWTRQDVIEDWINQVFFKHLLSICDTGDNDNGIPQSILWWDRYGSHGHPEVMTKLLQGNTIEAEVDGIIASRHMIKSHCMCQCVAMIGKPIYCNHHINLGGLTDTCQANDRRVNPLFKGYVGKS